MKTFTLFVGTEFDRNAAKIDPSERNDLVADAKRLIASKFGGYSASEVKGGYVMMSTSKFVEEGAIRFEVTTSDEREDEFKRMAREVRDMFRQESVLLNVATVETEFI